VDLRTCFHGLVVCMNLWINVVYMCYLLLHERFIYIGRHYSVPRQPTGTPVERRNPIPPPRSVLDAATTDVTINLGSFLNVISQVIKHQSNIHFALEFGGESDNQTSEPSVSTSMYLHGRVFQ
jgi:hypothetical protein